MFLLSTSCMSAKLPQSPPTLCDPMADCSLPGSSVHGIIQARILDWFAMLSSRGSSLPRGWTQVSCIAVDSLPSEPPGKPKNTGVGSLSLLQRIFLTQELNWGLLHCRWILYQLSYQGSPVEMVLDAKYHFQTLWLIWLHFQWKHMSPG